MIRGWLRRPVNRLIAMLCLLPAAGVAVVLPSTPAQAAYVYQGTYTIRWTTNQCLTVAGGGRTNETPVGLGSCAPPIAVGANQRWAIYRTDTNIYQINAYGGEWPLNMCLDGADHNIFMTIYGCHGHHQQRFTINAPSANFSSQLKLATPGDCVGIVNLLPSGTPSVQHNLNCNSDLGTSWSFTRVA
jgi:hypothetical protein